MRDNGFKILAPNGRLAVREISNAYEAAKFYANPNRSRISATNRLARVDVEGGTRKSLMAQSRWLYQNVPVYTGIVEALTTYTVGAGINPSAATSDEAFNQAVQEEWRVWAKMPDVRTRVPWSEYQRICVRGVLVDGEFFTQLTQGEQSYPRIAMIESHRVRDPDDRKRDSRTGTENREPDGIEWDKNGRVRFWLVPYEDSEGKQRTMRVRENFMVQSWLPIRADQYRGVTMFASAILTTRDLDDILSYEKSSVKRLSSRIDVVETQSGEIDPEMALRGMGVVSGSTPCPPVDELAQTYYRDVIGSETVVMRNGDKYAPVQSERPSPAWQGFVDFLVQSICQVTGLPHNVLIPVKIGGADTRRDLARAARVFEAWQTSLVSGWQRIYEYVVEDSMKRGRLPKAPPDWYKASWQFPKTVTVDYGREAKEDRADVKAGLMTIEEYWARYGLDWREQTQQLKVEADTVKATDEELYERMYSETGMVEEPSQTEGSENGGGD